MWELRMVLQGQTPFSLRTPSNDYTSKISAHTYIDLSGFILLQHQAEDLVIGTGTQTQVEWALIIRQLTQINWEIRQKAA